MYKKAAQIKLRFQAAQGNLTVEDLFDLTESQLDKLYQFYSAKLESQKGKGLIEKPTKEDVLTNLRLEIIKDVFETKVAKREALTEASEKAQKRQKLADIIARKQEAHLEDKSLEELQKELEELS